MQTIECPMILDAIPSNRLLLPVLGAVLLSLPRIRQAYVEIMDTLKTRIDEAVSAS
jgi:hypothetical protein